MMKKYFSLTLLLSMVLTLVSTIPVQAALDGTDPLDDTYPYIFLDYNTSVTTKTNGEGLTIAKAEWASGKGVGGTGALKVTDRNHNVNDPLVLPTLQDKESIQRNAYTISGWVKLVHTKKLDLQGNTIDENQDGKPDQWEFKSGPNLGVVLQYGYKENGSETTFNTQKFSQIPVVNDGKWHYITQTYNVGDFTGHDASKQYDWTTGIKTNFLLRFPTSTLGNDSKFSEIFSGFTSGNSTNQRGEILYYLDDFQYIPVVSETAPTGTVPVVDITSQATLAENFVDETVNISWNHTPSSVGINTVTESKVVVRVFKQISAVGEYATGGWALVDQGFARGNSFSYPLTADMLGDTYKFEVFPYDKVVDSGGRSTYRAGAIQTVSMTTSVVYPEVVTPKAGTPITFTPAERKITFELAEVTNNRSTPLNLFTIIALYDTNGALIDCRVNPLPSVAGNASLPALNLTHTVTLSTDAEYNEVASAKAFVWGGSGFSDTASHIAYATVSSKTK